MKNLLFVMFVALVCLGSGCEKSEYYTEGEYLYLKHRGAVMPVWVKGNIASKTFILTVHGGPGASGHEFAVTRAFQELERDYAVVYWDQRFSGMSQGDPKKETMNVDQFVEDLDLVVELIRQRYAEPKIFLLGHSWGGGLSAAWLGRKDNQSKVRGWIDVDGSVFDSLEVQAVKDWTLERVPAKIAAGKDPKFWNYVVQWYRDNPSPVYSDPEPYIFSGALDTSYQAAAFADSNGINYAKLLLRSPYSLAYFTRSIDAKMGDGIDFRPELRNIRVPALVLWGENDPTLPSILADFALKTLGTAPAKKAKVIFPNGGHSPHYEQPTRFVREMRGFVERWK
jgi:proline iminopeptidase